MSEHICLDPDNHQHFLDSFIYQEMTEEAKQALERNTVEYDGQVIHFPKGGIHPGHCRMMVMYPDENDILIHARTWTMPDGTVIRHNTKENVVDIVREEEIQDAS